MGWEEEEKGGFGVWDHGVWEDGTQARIGGVKQTRKWGVTSVAAVSVSFFVLTLELEPSTILLFFEGG